MLNQTHCNAILNLIFVKIQSFLLFPFAAAAAAAKRSEPETERMSVELLDGATIVSFLEDEEAFNLLIHDHFSDLDTNHDGFLSYSEILKEFQSLRVFETHFGVDVKREAEEEGDVYGSLFLKFDHDANGAVDLDEFKQETKRMMLAMANGLGILPVHMALEEDSFLKKAVEREEAAMKVIMNA